MTTEETVRAAIAAYAAKDLQGALSLCSRDVCFHNQSVKGTGMWEFDCREIDELQTALIQINSEFEIEAYELLDLIATGKKAASRQRLRIRIPQTGEVIETVIADFWEVEDGKITSIHEFNDTAQIISARKSAGCQ
ncbi:MAG: nuclear transport factor 2 family protein [Pseudomonadota bacterium]